MSTHLIGLEPTVCLFLNRHLKRLLLFLDEVGFRNLIVWLEDQKIRHYKIEERGTLRNVQNNEWPKHYEKVSIALDKELLVFISGLRLII